MTKSFVFCESFPSMPMFSRFLVCLLLLCVIGTSFSADGKAGAKPSKKKDIRDYTEADLERLYDEWEENDEDELPEDEKPGYRPPKSLNDMLNNAQVPDDLIAESKRGQQLIVFVDVVYPESDKKPTKKFTETIASFWQSQLYNNHIELKVYVTHDDRALLLLSDGSQMIEVRDFLVKQPQVSSVSIEGKITPGAGAKRPNPTKEEL